MADPIRVGLLGFSRTEEALFRLLMSIKEISLQVADLRKGLIPLPSGFVAIQEVGPDDVAEFVRQHDIIVCNSPFAIASKAVAAAARESVVFINTSEDRQITAMSQSIGGTDSLVISRWGLDEVVEMIAKRLAEPTQIDDLRIAMGHLPLYPTGQLRHHRPGDIQAMIDRYCSPCEVIWNHQRLRMPPLADIETIIIDGVSYEAFSVDHQAGPLIDYLSESVRNLSFKTISHTGHCGAMKLLLDDLRLRDHPQLLHDILAQSLPCCSHDTVLIAIHASGNEDGIPVTRSYVRKIFGKNIAGIPFTAGEYAKASAVAALIDVIINEGDTNKNSLGLEDIALNEISQSSFFCPFE